MITEDKQIIVSEGFEDRLEELLDEFDIEYYKVAEGRYILRDISVRDFNHLEKSCIPFQSVG